MIDFNTIESAIGDQIINTLTAGTFKSVEIGRIREDIPVTIMPSMDLAVTGHSTQQNANRAYTVNVIIVIRSKGTDRADNAAAFKDFVKSVIDSLEGFRDSSIDAIRGIGSNLGEHADGSGAFIRSVVITLNVLSH